MDITLERILSLLPHKEDGTLAHGARRELGRVLGLKSGNLVSDWINGRKSSYTDYVYEIAAKYSVSPAWLKGETDDPTPAEIPAAAILDRMIDGMDREQLVELINRAVEKLGEKSK